MIKQYIQLYLKKHILRLRQTITAAILLAMLCMSSCTPSRENTTLPLPTIIDSYSHENIHVTILATPAKLHLNKDLFFNITIEAPPEVSIILPDFAPLCRGLTLVSEFDTPAIIKNNKTLHTHRILLRPKISPIYAIKPFSISYKNRSYNPAVTGSIDVAEIVFLPVLKELSPSDDIITDFSPIETPVAKQTRVAKTITILLFLLIIVAQIIRYNRNNQKSTMPLPRSIALHDLNQLLNSDLIARKEFTEFYFALTTIVRRYIEDILKVPSTHQTSEELIKNLQQDQRIDEAMLANLKKFFQSADLIKFSESSPTPANLANDIEWAKQYIELDMVADENEEDIL